MSFVSMPGNKSAPLPDQGGIAPRINKKRKADASSRSDWRACSKPKWLPLDIAELIVPYFISKDLGKLLLINHTWSHLVQTEASVRLKKEGYPESLITLAGSVRMVCSEIAFFGYPPGLNCLRLDYHAVMKSARAIGTDGCCFAHLTDDHRHTVIFTGERTATGFGPISKKTPRFFTYGEELFS